MGALEEPVGPRAAVQAMRAEARGLHDAADRPGLDELRRPGHRRHLETLGEVDRPDAARRLLRGPDRVELGLRDHARLVDHHVLAVAHGRDRDVGALARNAGRDDQLHLRVVQQRLRVRDALEVGKALDEALQRHRLVAAVKTLAFGAERQQAADLMVDVAVIEPDRGELEGWMVRHAGPGFSLRAP